MVNYRLSILSEINELEKLLAGMPENHTIERTSLQSRLESVKSELSASQYHPCHPYLPSSGPYRKVVQNNQSYHSHHHTHGKFIVLEGLDGSGKTTLSSRIADWLHSLGISAVTTREPGGTLLAEDIRALTKTDQFRHASAISKTLMMFAARHDLVRFVIQPALQQGSWVISDRFTESSYAYQGYGEGVDLSMIGYLESQTTDNIRPELVLLLDIPVSISEERCLARSIDQIFSDRDVMSRGFLSKVRHGYLSRADSQQSLYEVVDATMPIDEVFRRIQEIMWHRFPDDLYMLACR